ncbi:hypothetical protein BN946_scf184911.g29 [Trametes cinnabarina]|uniref:Secreted protein n=1 Tax=Pycnoporus cinnabarinus TaxID=5643 RepID=A0A060SH37_PYCCI|nr:hypothetical protein BN946_scf184911.g29 [Trametes cinnabarina]
MPALTRAVFLGLQAAALVSLVGPAGTPTAALAKPIPFPAPMMPHLADYAAQPPVRGNLSTVPSSQNLALAKRLSEAVVSHTPSQSSALTPREDDTSILNNINILSTVYNGMSGHSTAISDLASRASAGDADDSFSELALSHFTAYKEGLLQFNTVLVQLAADKGLANYDNTNGLETLLKDMVNMTKYALNDLDALVANIPAVGPLLAPVMYEVKCILDEVLDAVENLTDAILNVLQPLLEPLIGQYAAAVCNLGLEIGSLCLML